jgi:hypothetical protein
LADLSNTGTRDGRAGAPFVRGSDRSIEQTQRETQLVRVLADPVNAKSA